MPRLRIRYADIAATLALVLATGGTAYAAVELKKNQVKTKHIANKAVGSKQLKNRAIKPGHLSPAVRSQQAAWAEHFTPPTWTLTKGSFVERTITWTQPPGTLDELTGSLVLFWPSACTKTNGTVLMALLSDNQVISAQAATDLANGNGPLHTPDVASSPSYVRFEAPLVPQVVAPPRTDHVTLPIEKYQFVSGSSSVKRTVRIRTRYLSCNGDAQNPAAPPQLRSQSLFVTRHRR